MLVLDPERFDEATLRALATELRGELSELHELVRRPRGRVLDPASLETAETLLAAAEAMLDRPGPRDRADRARDANLAYATVIAVVDLVKSHTEGPRVPIGPRRSPERPA